VEEARHQDLSKRRSRNGHHRPVNIPHAVGWLAGAAAAIGVRGGQRAVLAGRNLVTRVASAGGREIRNRRKGGVDARIETKTTERASTKAHLSKHYEMDGALRAYANRMAVLGLTCGALAVASLGLFAYVRLQPPS
jgi:hypothetical protein